MPSQTNEPARAGMVHKAKDILYNLTRQPVILSGVFGAKNPTEALPVEVLLLAKV